MADTNALGRGSWAVIILACATFAIISSVSIWAIFGSSTTRIESIAFTGPASIGTDAGVRTILANKDGMMCAEPAPDTVTSYLRGAKVNSVLDLVGAGKTDQGTELIDRSSLTKLFERSQGIQALRDGMYRLCEASLNEQIPKEVYAHQMSDLIATLNFIVPIELCSKLSRELYDIAENAVQVVGASALPTEARRKGEDQRDDVSVVSGSSILARLVEVNVSCIADASAFGRELSANAQQRLISLRADDNEKFANEMNVALRLLNDGADCASIAMLIGRKFDCSKFMPNRELAQATEPAR